MTEHVELPCGGRVRTHHMPLKPDAVHEVPDRGLGAGEVGVGFVVGAAHDLDAALPDEPAQVGPVLGMGVPVRLEVVDLGEHELVFRVATGHFEVGVHEFEAVGLAGATGRVLGPFAGVRGLGVPPHRVVVEVTDHEHRPAGLGVGEGEVQPLVPHDGGGRAVPAGFGVGHRHRDLHHAGARGDVGPPRQPVTLDADRRGPPV